jgi:hypothetical protein
VKSQRLAQQAQLARVDHVRCGAVGCARDCVLEPAAAAQQANQTDAFGVDRVAAFVVVGVREVLVAPGV